MSMTIDLDDLAEALPIFFGVLFGVCILAWLLLFFLKREDKSKPLQKRLVKIIERTVQQGNVAWYVMECDTGERLKLRTFEANSILISPGDQGIVEYRGQTIERFTRRRQNTAPERDGRLGRGAK